VDPTTPKLPQKSQFVLQHPSDPSKAIAYGWEGPHGYFAILFVSGRISASRALPDVTRREARKALIEWSIELGFFSLDDLDDATAALEKLPVEKLSKRLRTLCDVIRSFSTEVPTTTREPAKGGL
jgi:hypothetical protein